MTAEQKRNALEVTPVQNGHIKSNGAHTVLNGTSSAAPTCSQPPAAAATSAAAPPAAEDDSLEECTLWVAFVTYLAYFVLVAVGYVKEFLFPVHQKEKDRQGYTPLYLSFESFYIRNVYRRMSACFNNPLASCPGGQIDIQLRETPDYGFSYSRTGEVRRCINFGSYNYLGFAENSGPCTDTAERLLRRDGVAPCSSRMHLGSQQCQDDLEALVAEYLGVEDAVTFSMGFATNALNIPTLVGRGSLVISDQLNHASLILGLRLSGATIDVFKHNDMKDLERKLRRAIVDGHPRTHRPWKKILIVVEGIYSMEGSICKLPEIIALKKKYKAYLYLDEAHSIGALGPTGRGVCEYYGCDTRDIDVLMGTFTKSFGAIGGYMAGSRRLIAHVRRHSHSMFYASGLPPPVAGQISAVLCELLGRGGAGVGRARIRRLTDNTRYFRKRLSQMGFILYGDDDSPVVPLLIFLPAKACAFWSELMKHNVATVIVGFPATPILKVRCRFCVSAAHNKEVLDKILDLIDKIGDDLEIKYSSRPRTNHPIEYGRC
ncbi:serine palmitoyltransferase 2-like isoform X2 [Amphibalanus amphitrite]|uniref:serine palmitoyltransferase 2-like isoform X2 n=1 Tax=Amphibalanus amphitrite TaxID=1232801 RepID=UPI001C918EC8|nr:serine palmitoyltransferase 2-like isoform X2 [Amphibalanus amphitrite]